MRKNDGRCAMNLVPWRGRESGVDLFDDLEGFQKEMNRLCNVTLHKRFISFWNPSRSSKRSTPLSLPLHGTRFIAHLPSFFLIPVLKEMTRLALSFLGRAAFLFYLQTVRSASSQSSHSYPGWHPLFS